MTLEADPTATPVDATPVDTTPSDSGATSRLPRKLVDSRIIAVFPKDSVGSLVGAVEVMVQEGIGVFSFPGALVERVAELGAMFGPRAVFAAHDVTAEQLDEVLAGPAQVVALVRPDEDLVRRVHEAGRAVLLGALTPSEVQHAGDLGADAVVVVPAEVMGSSYPEQLVDLVPGVVLAARGGLGAYSARRWIEAGASFVCLDAALIGDAATGGSLGGLRERCQTFVTAVE